MSIIERFAVRQVMFPQSYSTFAEDVIACSELGFGGLAIWSAKLGDGPDEASLDLMCESPLMASVCSLTVNSVLPQRSAAGPLTPQERIEAMSAGIHRLAPFAPTGVVVLTGGGDGLSPDMARKMAVDGLRELAGIAQACGMDIELEPIRNPEGNSLVSSLRDTAELVADVDSNNVGIAYDVWHHWDSATAIEDIANFAELIRSVHIADWRIPPRGKMDRVLPGEGVIDLARMLAALEEGGFKGWYELEVFSDATYDDSILRIDQKEMLSRAWSGFLAAWSNAGLT